LAADNDLSVKSMDQHWTLMAGMLVFFMQAGFGMLEAGTVRAKNQQNILVKNVVDASVGGVAFWALGYGFAFGAGDNEFIGGTDWFLAANEEGSNGMPWIKSGYHFWVFQWAFAATASTIVSGAVAERTQFIGYIIYTVFITAFVYPVVVHWGWTSVGWLSARGFTDFAGSGIVHMVGGAAALIGAIITGPRLGRFKPGTSLCCGQLDPENEREFKPSNTLMQALGTIILWMGWYGFNPGSTVAMSGDNHLVASRAAINTTLAPCFAALTATIYMMIRQCINKSNSIELGVILNCILGGLVGITAGCAALRPWQAALVGIVSVPVYLFSSALLKKLKIDDAIDASPVHLFCGFWGCLAVGIFSDLEAQNKTGDLFAIQLGGSVAIFVWTVATSGAVFLVLRLSGLLRASDEDQI
jgi:Amt family ammonium transporter